MSNSLPTQRAPRRGNPPEDVEQAQVELSDEEYALLVAENQKKARRRRLLEKLIPFAALIACGAVGWLVYIFAARNGFPGFASCDKSAVGTRPQSYGAPGVPGGPQGYEPTAKVGEDRPPGGGFSEARVEVYVSTAHPEVGCALAREFLARHRIPFTEYDIDTDEHALGRFTHMNPQKTLPFAIVNGRQLTGFNPKVWYGALVGEDGDVKL